MITADPQKRAARLAELQEILARTRGPRGPGAAPVLRAGRLRGDARPHRPGPPRRGPGGADPGALPLRGARDAAGHPALQGAPGHPRLGPQPERGRVPGHRRRGRPAPWRRPSSRPTPWTRRSSSRASRTTSRRRACACSPPSIPSSPSAGSGSASSRIGGLPGRGLEGVVLPLPDRADRLQGAPAPHRARDLLGAEGRLHGGRGLPGHGPGRRARWGRACAVAAGRRGRRRVGPGLPGLAAPGQLHLPGHGPLPHRRRRPARPHPGERLGRLHRPGAAAGRVSGRHGGGRDPHPARAAGTTGSSTSTTATTPRRSTTSSRSTTS